MSIQSVEAAAADLEAARQRLLDQIRAAQTAGVPDAAIARAAKVSRQTIHTWTKRPAIPGEVPHT